MNRTVLVSLYYYVICSQTADAISRMTTTTTTTTMMMGCFRESGCTVRRKIQCLYMGILCAKPVLFTRTFFLFIIIIFFSLPSEYIYVFMCVYNITRRHVRCFTRFTCTYHAPTVQTIIYYRLPSPSRFLYAVPTRRSLSFPQSLPPLHYELFWQRPGFRRRRRFTREKRKTSNTKRVRWLTNIRNVQTSNDIGTSLIFFVYIVCSNRIPIV